MLFGSEGRTRLDVARLRKLTSGFSNYKTDGLVLEASNPAASATAALARQEEGDAATVVIPKEAVELLAVVFVP